MNNRDPFEDRLARIPFRSAPASLRGQVLHTVQHAEKAGVAGIRWRTRIADWLWPNPLAWGSLGVAWLVVVVLNLASLGSFESNPPPPVASRISPAWSTVLLEQRALFQSLLQDPVAPAFSPRDESGAQLGLPEKATRFLV